MYPPSLGREGCGNDLRGKEIEGNFRGKTTGLQREHNDDDNANATGDGRILIGRPVTYCRLSRINRGNTRHVTMNVTITEAIYRERSDLGVG